ncbi:MAG: 3-deoxy-D-manno-octulosonic acid transferase [Flavobacteriales bacterium]|nr:3-deoxy-D-manno-octulosonic acid transferase [Flavobacteriales bacterium]
MTFIEKILYKLTVRIIYLVIYLYSFINSKARKWIKGRNNTNLIFSERDYSKKLIWMHASSLGEYEQGLPVFNELKKQFNDYQFAISFYSPSGYDVISKKNKEDFIFYFPLDTTKQAKRLIKNLQPSMLILVKYDYWYITLHHLIKNNIPIYVISAKFKPSFIAFKKYGKWFYSIFKKINYFFVQDEKSLQILKENNINHVIVAGDTRFDRVKELINIPKTLDFLDEFKDNKLLFVAGSTWKKDNDLLSETYKNRYEKLKFVIVPHEINKDYMQLLKQKFPNSILYSEIDSLEDKNISDYKALIIDTIGILTKIYAYADISYVGGAFDHDGVHNVLEPAVFGVPVLFGTNIKKYKEAQELVEKGGGIIIKNHEELSNQLVNLIEKDEVRLSIGHHAKKMIINTKNATQIIVSTILNKKNSL